MAKILKFPGKMFAPLTVRDGRKHVMLVEVLDTVRPRRTRWILQFEVQEVAGYEANTGLTDRAVAEGCRHRFHVTSTAAVRRFVTGTFDLVSSGRIAVWIDGRRLQPALARQA